MEPSAKRPRVEELGVLDDSFDNDESFMEQAPPALNDSFEDESILEGPPLLFTQGAAAVATQQQVLSERQVHVAQPFDVKSQALPSVANPSTSAQSQRPMFRTSSTSLTQSAMSMARMEFQNPSQQESGLVMMLRRKVENQQRELEHTRKKLGMQAAAREEERRNEIEGRKREKQALINERDALKRQVLSMSMSTSSMNITTTHSQMVSSNQHVDMNTSFANRSIVPTRPVERRVSMPRPAVPKPRTTRNSIGANRSPAVFKHSANANETYQHFSTQQMVTEDSMFLPPKPPVAGAAPHPPLLTPKIEPKTEPIETRNSECQTGNVDEEMMKHEGIVILETDPRDELMLSILTAALRSDTFSFSKVEPLLRGTDYISLSEPESPSKSSDKSNSSSPK